MRAQQCRSSTNEKAGYLATLQGQLAAHVLTTGNLLARVGIGQEDFGPPGNPR